VSKVIATVAWPSASETIFTGTLWTSPSVAKVWRVSFTRHTVDSLDQILAAIRLLDSVQRQQLLEQLEALVQQESDGTDVSILSLQGLGHKIWEGMDAQEYVQQERASWPG
jgi:hypothetical protein